LCHDRSNAAARVGSSDDEGESAMKIQIKRVEAIKATRIHLDPDAGGA
jgi:hypothetical protein